MIGLGEIKAARGTIADFVHRTPLFSSQSLSKLTGSQIWLKAECLQKTGSFKPRGATNKIKPLVGQKIGGVLTVSSGNHGQATAYVAGRLGIPAVILVAEGTPQAKIDAARGYGAEVIIGGSMNNIEPLIEKAYAMCAEKNYVPIHPFDDPLIVAGQGTIGLEIIEDLPDVDIVTVPVGGGGLLGGIAIALKQSRPHVRVFGIGPVNASSMFTSYHEKKPVVLHEMPDTAADGIRSPIISEMTLELALKYVDDIITVTDAELIETMQLVWSRSKLVVEPSGVSSFAAVKAKKIPRADNAKIVCILSGGNVDLKKAAKYLAQ
jgi:threonine dehydratase